MLPYLILERAFAFANTRAPSSYLRGADTTWTRQSCCNMSSSSDMEVDECGTGARWPPNCKITEQELCFVRRLVNRRSFPTKKRLDDWLRIMEEVVKVLGILYRSSFRLLESNNFKDESILDLLRTVYISAMAEVDVVKRERT